MLSIELAGSIIAGLGAGNVVYQHIKLVLFADSPDWEVVVERTIFQAVAVLAVYATLYFQR